MVMVFSQSTTFYLVCVLNIIVVAAFALAFYGKVEHLLYGNFPFVKSAQWYWVFFKLFHPLLIDFLKGDAASLADGFNQPDVSIDKRIY